jgi:hypothetical protein
MKEFRKSQEGLFICEECGKLCGDKKYLSKHVSLYHNKKEYYDKWLLEKGEGKCKICNNETKFIGFARNNGYESYCCKKCIDRGRYIQTCLGNEKLYGVKNPYQRDDVKEKIKQTTKERYGDENYRNRDKIKQTWLEKYGVEHNMQNKKTFEKQQQSGFLAKKYNDTNIIYRGTYEFDFLDKYLSLYPDIMNAKPIKYFFKEKQHYYFPDFFIPSLNLIIEIKASYYYNKFKKYCETKEKSTIANGFNYIIIIDKNYKEFNLFLKSA